MEWETTDRHVQRINRVIDGIRALPGVESVAITSALPGVRDEQQVEFVARRRACRLGAAPLVAEIRVVSPGYFETLRIPLLAGELCRRPADAGGKTGVVTEALVNRRFAELYLADRRDHRSSSRWRTRFVRQERSSVRCSSMLASSASWATRANVAPTAIPRRPCTPASVLPTPRRGTSSGRAAIRWRWRKPIRRKIHELEPHRSVYDVAPLETRIGDAFAQNRLRTWLADTIRYHGSQPVCCWCLRHIELRRQPAAGGSGASPCARRASTRASCISS